jgi:hypothetical protein
MNNTFFVKDGYLAYKINNNFIRQYFPIDKISNIDFILNSLNENIKNVTIIDNPIENKMLFKINNRDFLQVICDTNNMINIFIFNLVFGCNKCDYKIS